MMRRMFRTHAAVVAVRAGVRKSNANNLAGRTVAQLSAVVQNDAISISQDCHYLARRHMNIYTKTGDKGTSALFSGERRRKHNLRFQALGATDELSSSLGLSIAFAEENNHGFVEELVKVQCLLQDVGSFIATPAASAREAHTSKLHFDSDEVVKLEKAIDRMSEELPPLTNFILPSGGKTSSSLHQARSVCRRAERLLAELMFEEELNESIFRYINRLSDYLFTLARYAAMKEGKKEHIYRPTNKANTN